MGAGLKRPATSTDSMLVTYALSARGCWGSMVLALLLGLARRAPRRS